MRISDWSSDVCSSDLHVLEANSGETALEILARQEDPIDLLVTDVVMPRLDGPSLVREVRQTRPDLTVLFLSGYAEDSFRKRLADDTGIHFLPNTFTLTQLACTVKRSEMHTSAP